MIRAFLVLCMHFNPTMCLEKEIVPADFHAVSTPAECSMGGLIFGFGTVIHLDGIEWETHGIRCRMAEDTIAMDLKGRVKEE